MLDRCWRGIREMKQVRTATALFILLSAAGGSALAQEQGSEGLPQAEFPTVLSPEPLSFYGDPQAPDLSGVWVRVDADANAGATATSKEGWLPWPPPLRPEFDKTWRERVAKAVAGERTDDPVRGCLPPGMPRYVTGTNSPMVLMQVPGVVMMYRYGIPFRRVWLTGVKLPDPVDREEFFNGYAIGHYEGSDLVTEVVGMKDLPIDGTGIPHSPNLHISERYHRIDATTMRVTVKLTDPTAYTRPMTSTVIYKAYDKPRWEIDEFVCTPITDYHPQDYVR